jgi:hypothetical protein
MRQKPVSPQRGNALERARLLDPVPDPLHRLEAGLAARDEQRRRRDSRRRRYGEVGTPVTGDDGAYPIRPFGGRDQRGGSSVAATRTRHVALTAREA